MRKGRIQLGAVLFALLIALGTVRKTESLQSPDFKVFFVAARHVLNDPVNLYRVSPDRFLYPPSAAILLTPFALTGDFGVWHWVWHGLLGCVLAGLAASSAAALAAMLVLTRYLLNTFPYGQINLVVLGLLAAAGGLAKRGQRRGAGGAWAVATAFKVYPVIFGPWLFSRENRRALAAGIGAGLLLLALPFLLWGPALAGQLYGEFFQALQSKGLPLDAHNQSIQALFMRLFGGQQFPLLPFRDANWTLFPLPHSWIVGAAYAVGLTLSVAAWKKAYAQEAGDRKTDACLSAGAFSLLFLSHIVWKDYLLFLYFPLRELFGLWPFKKSAALGAGLIALATLSSMDIVGWRLAAGLDGACIHLGGAVLVWFLWIL